MSSPAKTLEQLKAEIVSYSHKLGFRGWVANHDGNISVRLPEGRFLVTPTAVPKSDIDHTMLLVIDESGAVVAGNRKVFSEWELHRAVFDARPDVQAVVHAHPPHATAHAVAGIGMYEPIMAEAVVSLGRAIPLVPFFAPKSEPGLATLREFAHGHDALLLENHGVLTYGPTLEHAYLRMELVEHQARIRLIAKQLGGYRALPEDTVAMLLQAREKAGLLTPGERSGEVPLAQGQPALDPQVLRDFIARAVAEELSNQ